MLSSFMGGLGLGNALAGRWGGRLRFPVRAYALLEIVVGVAGLALVVLLPWGGEALAPLFRPFLDRPLPLNTLRLGLAFLMLMVPCTAMGATLPLLVKALRARDPSFGRALGRLYGWNTLGGVIGALAVEMVLVARFGLRGSAIVAAMLNAAAAAGAFWLVRGTSEATPAAIGTQARLTGRARRLLAVAALCGATLLALEVVWLRFLQLFLVGTGLNFALILATVLLGITLGALAAGRLLGRWPGAHDALPVASLAAAFFLVFAYIAMDRIEPLAATDRLLGVALVVAWVALPTCVVSGALFTLAGAALQREMDDDVRASASLTLANTMGGMVGAALGGFVLLPQLGMERSFFLLALSYVAVTLLCLHAPYSRRLRMGLAAAGALAGLLLVLFPFGLMENHYLKRLRLAHDSQASLAALREGRTETIQYLRRDFLGEPLSFRMLTNRYSMSATGDVAQRYMRLFVYWALAARPQPERALLISYGVGTTAKALTEVSSLRSIDVVDISADVLALAPVPFPPPAVDPLRDPRVRVHVEDGRFFLQASGQTFDLITAEPPPLKVAGVVSLYTQEYFEHVRARLAPGGVVTYWLPVYQVGPDEARTVVRGFCNAFPDCTLWNAASLEWMLAGTRDGTRPVDEEAFTRPWRDPIVGPRLREIAVESPEALGTTFLADAEQLRAWTGPGVPLVDDYPQRLSAHGVAPGLDEYVRFMDAADARRRFAESRYIATVWPPGLRVRTDAHFEWQALVNAHLLSTYGQGPPPGLAALQRVLGRGDLPTLAVWMMDSSPREQAILERVLARGTGDLPAGPQAVRSLMQRDYGAAGRWLEEAARSEPRKRWSQLRALNALLGGDRVEARRLAEDLRSRPGAPPDPQFVQWLEANLAASPPGGGP